MQNSKLLGGILLIAGTTIGAAMLALPLSTGLGGFGPAVLIMTACWLFMLWIGFLFVEANLYFDTEVNLIHMAKATLGNGAAFITWVVYLCLFYALLAAYLSGGGSLLVDFVNQAFDVHWPLWTGPILVLGAFGPFVYRGLRTVDFLNRYLMIGLVLSYLLMVAALVPQAQLKLLSHIDGNYLFFSLSIMITAFGYHVIIPSLVNYLDRDVKNIKICIFLGSFLPFLVYLVWESMILAVIPVTGEGGLAHILDEGISLSRALMLRLDNHYVSAATGTFAILAIATSLLGVAVGLFDFLRDGLATRQWHASRPVVFLLTFGPPLVFALLYEKGFLLALEYAGVMVAILLCMLPITMVWSARYYKKLKGAYRAPGGPFALIAGFLFSCFIVALVIAKNLGYVS